uniref:Uncharacterized protein n=1 Tax=Wuchereria bancrofti TaxID=6293 RepID=A0AAF5Q6D4_WUCBA
MVEMQQIIELILSIFFHWQFSSIAATAISTW